MKFYTKEKIVKVELTIVYKWNMNDNLKYIKSFLIFKIKGEVLNTTINISQFF